MVIIRALSNVREQSAAELVRTLGANVLWKIASDNTFWESITRVRADMYKNLALVIGFTVQGNTDVDPGVEKTDRFTAISLEYSF
jgi:putative salt-induced outer membrane protein YdiY